MYNSKAGFKLNLGCGPDWRELKERFNFYGVDIVDFGQDFVWDLRRGLPFEDNSVDAIRASHFFEHLTPGDAKRLLNECWRVLKPSGQIHIVVPAGLHPKAYVLTHRSFWTQETFYDLSREDRWKVYGIRRWQAQKVVENERGDIHVYLAPLDK